MANSSVRFRCPACSGAMKAPAAGAGESCRCPKCDALVRVPSSTGKIEATPRASTEPPPGPIPSSETNRREVPPRNRSNATPTSAKKSAQSSTTVPGSPSIPTWYQRCPLCRSTVEVRADQVGATVSCDDCHSLIVVMAPAAASDKKPAKVGRRAENIATPADQDLVTDFRLSDPVQTPRYLPSPGEEIDALELYGEKAGGSTSAAAEIPGVAGAPVSPEGGDRIPSSRSVPSDSVPSDSVPSDSVPSGSVPSGTEDNTVGVQCPLCHSRLHVATRKIGQAVRCPDCHNQFTAKAYRVPAKKGPTVTELSDEAEEIRLGEACSLPKFQPLTRGEVSRAQLDAVEPSSASPKSPAAPARSTSSASAETGGRRGGVVKVVCPHCQTRLEVAAREMGGTTKCGDCGNEVKLEIPRTQPRSARQAVTVDPHDELAISSETWDAHRQRADVREARRLYQAEQKLEKKRLEEELARATAQASYSRRLFSFLREPEVLSRGFLLVMLFAVTSGLGAWITVMAAGSDASQWGFAAPLSVFFAFSLMMTWMYGASVVVTIVQDTAEEFPAMENWSSEVMEWMYQAAQIFFAAAAAGGAASVVALALSSLPLPAILIALIMLAVCFVSFPVILLSILEGGNLFCFVSPVVWGSVIVAFPAWFQFYGVAIALLIPLVVTELGVFLGGPWVALLSSPVVVLGGLLYFRALGLLASHCSARMGELRVAADAGADEAE